MERWFCEECSSDLCFKCFPANGDIPLVKCNNGHVLVDWTDKYGAKADNGWACDGRARPGGCKSGCTGFRQSKDWIRMRCDECDWDLCLKCQQDLLQKAAQKFQELQKNNIYDPETLKTLDDVVVEITEIRAKLKKARQIRVENQNRINELTREVNAQKARADTALTSLVPFEDAWKEPQTTYSLPESIYTGAMIFPLSGPWNETDMSTLQKWCFFGLPLFNYFLVLAATFSAQFLFIQYVRLEVGSAVKSCEASHLLVMLGLVTFFVQLISDIFQTFGMAGWILMMKTSEKMETLEYVVDKSGEVKFKSGLYKWYKWFWCVPIVAAKLLLSLVVAYYGSFFVAASETNMDVILNCVALCFIFELDDYAYTFFTQDSTRQVIAEMPELKQKKHDLFFICSLCCGPCCIMILLVLLSYWAYGSMCVGQNPSWVPFGGNATSNLTMSGKDDPLAGKW
jgi:hypothetical protein